MPADRQLPPALSPYVLTLSAYDLAPGADGVHRGLPSTALSVMLPQHEPVDIGWADAPTSQRSLWSVVSGLHSRPALIHQPGRQRGIWMTLTPLGARALFGLPAAALSGEITDLGTVAPAMADLPEQLAALSSPDQRLRLVQRALLRALAANDDHAPLPHLRRTLDVVARTTRVQEAADVLGWSRRQISSTFRSEFGVTPKEYQRIARFEASRGRLTAMAQAGPVSLATVAAMSGYADHAHLTREWRSMADCTPTHWLASEHASQTFKP
jgi:AraC-like DNA-binding protein